MSSKNHGPAESGWSLATPQWKTWGGGSFTIMRMAEGATKDGNNLERVVFGPQKV